FSIDARTVAVANLRSIRAALFTHNLNREGAPFIQLELTVGLRDQSVIDPIVYSPIDGPLRMEYERLGLRVEVLSPPESLYSEAGYNLTLSRLVQWLRDRNVELVYGNTLLTFYAIEAASVVGLPSVWNPRESEPWQTYFSDFDDAVSARALQCFSHPYKV